jgi:hypothetical protein
MTKYKKRIGKAGWVMDGVRVYHIKGTGSSKKRSFRTKGAALAHLHRRGKRQ